MHIPDGFLATPVWAALDAAAVPTVAYMARRAQRGFDDGRAPLLGVMGAFVFAAQMINFPVAAGASGHLLGAALLSYTLGPAAAGLVMTAILAIQALVFQDGGVLALGANTINMAVAGVLAGYLPYALWGAGRWRRFAVFLGGAASALAAAAMALAELLISGAPIPRSVLGASGVVFLMAALLEGAITMAVIGAMEKIEPGFVRKPQGSRRAMAAAGAFAVFLAAAGFLFTSSKPDGIQRLAEQTGTASRNLLAAPFAEYQASFLREAWQGKTVAGLAGLGVVWGACLIIGRSVARKRRS